MKKSDILDHPQRQSQFAIIFIVLRFLKNLAKQLWPLLLAVMLGRRGSSTFDTIEMIVAGVGIIGVVPSIIAYYKYYFHLSENELVINKGLLKKVKLNIPFERIQSVNFRQTFLHQFFKVTEVEIETAGSSDQETKIDALDIPTAELLRKRILELKAQATQDGGSLSLATEEAEQVAETETILRLTERDLLKVGLVQNHIRPIGLLIGLIAPIYFYTFSFDFNPNSLIREVYSYFDDFQNVTPLIALIVGIGILIVAVLYSLVTTVLRHYNLHFWRSGEKFQVVRGLFTKQEFAALDNKIQILNWGQNPFERIIGFYNIIFSQAKSGDSKSDAAKFEIPGCSMEQVNFVQEAWLGIKGLNFDEYRTVSPHLFYHTAIYQVLFLSIPMVVFFYLGKPMVVALFLLFLTTSLYLSWLNYKKKKYAFNDKEIYIGGGTVGLRHSLLPLYKIQDVNIRENPYQWRRGLSTLVVNTAGGAIKIPYIPREEAISMMDELVYRVEVSKRSWM